MNIEEKRIDSQASTRIDCEHLNGMVFKMQHTFI